MKLIQLLHTGLFGAVTTTLILLATANAAFASVLYQTGSTGVDISYPNCHAFVPRTSFGIVGVEGGLGFSENPCLANEAVHFPNVSLYANTGYPGATAANAQKYMVTPKVCVAGDLNCIAYDYGYNQGLYAYAYATSQGVHSQTWWLDVETVNSWTNDPNQNQQSLLGEHDALVASGVSIVGIYSTTAQWDEITGSWINNWPSWGATTWSTARQAMTYCRGHQFTGGQSLLMQFVARHQQLDQDVAC
ncbi:MAG TPA: hypothetical protein VGS28_03100 [Candidatus Saccharimonadales bacterium]|nr:hypothetical protein [Candidatus Saccharimonadales bacterium]